jgi:hypothetical protein
MEETGWTSITEDDGNTVRMRYLGRSESALLDHMLSVVDAINRGEAEYRHEDVALRYLRMFET